MQEGQKLINPLRENPKAQAQKSSAVACVASWLGSRAKSNLARQAGALPIEILSDPF